MLIERDRTNPTKYEITPLSKGMCFIKVYGVTNDNGLKQIAYYSFKVL